MQGQPTPRRGYGSGSLTTKRRPRPCPLVRRLVRLRAQDQAHARPRGVPGAHDGLTSTQAEARLRELMGRPPPSRATGERLTVVEVAGRYVRARPRHSGASRPRSEHRVRGAHAPGPVLRRALDRPDHHRGRRRPDRGAGGQGPGAQDDPQRDRTLSALFNFAKAPRRRWATDNPCEGVELPASPRRRRSGS